MRAGGDVDLLIDRSFSIYNLEACSGRIDLLPKTGSMSLQGGLMCSPAAQLVDLFNVRCHDDQQSGGSALAIMEI